MFRIIALFLIALTIALVGGLACSSDDDGTLNESNAGPSPSDDDDDDDIGPIVDDDDDDDDDDDTIDDDTDDDDSVDDDTYEGDITSIWIEPEFMAEPRGTEIQYVANGWGTEGQEVHNVDVNWSVNDPEIASINENGLLTTLANGRTQVIATLKDYDQIANSATLFVSGDVFVLDQENGYVGMIDIYDDSVVANYLAQGMSDTPTSMAIYNYNFMGIGYESATSSGFQNADIEPDNHVLLDQITIPENQAPLNLTTVNWSRVYITLPDTDSLLVIGQQGPNFGIAGYIYCRDDDHPTDVAYYEQYIAVTASNSVPALNDYNDGMVYFYNQSNLLMRSVEIENENPFAITVALDEDENVFFPVLSSGKPGVSSAKLYIVNSGMNVQDSITINGAPAVMSAGETSQIWIGDGDDPYVYAYDLDSDDWLIDPDDPLELVGAGSITAIKVTADRKEVYIGAENGNVYRYDIDDGSVGQTYTFGSQFLPIDIEIW